jgi:hypothetical protein
MRKVYLAMADVGRRFFRLAGIPVPRSAQRMHHILVRSRLVEVQPDLREEVAALARAVDRLETIAYIDEISRRPD